MEPNHQQHHDRLVEYIRGLQTFWVSKKILVLSGFKWTFSSVQNEARFFWKVAISRGSVWTASCNVDTEMRKEFRFSEYQMDRSPSLGKSHKDGYISVGLDTMPWHSTLPLTRLSVSITSHRTALLTTLTFAWPENREKHQNIKCIRLGSVPTIVSQHRQKYDTARKGHAKAWEHKK